MKTVLFRRCRRPVFLAGAVLTLAACSVQHSIDARYASGRMQPVPLTVNAWRLMQLNYGRQAHFALCAVPACPALTSKTAAVAVPPHTTADRDEEATAIADAGAAPFRAEQVVIFFAPGATVPDCQARRALQQFTGEAQRASRIHIVARTDSTGEAGLNQLIAERRAAQVARYLRQLAPQSAATWTRDVQGACCYASENDTPDGRSGNRRVEVAFFRGQDAQEVQVQR